MFPFAKVRHAYSYKKTQSSRGLDRVHGDAVFFRLSLDTSVTWISLCLVIVSIEPHVLQGESSIAE